MRNAKNPKLHFDVLFIDAAQQIQSKILNENIEIPRKIVQLYRLKSELEQSKQSLINRGMPVLW